MFGPVHITVVLRHRDFERPALMAEGIEKRRGPALAGLDAFLSPTYSGRSKSQCGVNAAHPVVSNHPPRKPARSSPRLKYGLRRMMRQMRPLRKFSIIVTVSPSSMPRSLLS